MAEETTTTEATTTTTEATTTSSTTTTTLPTTTTTTIPVVGSGTWIVPDDVPPETYRLSGYAARLDSELEIIDNFLIGDDGLGLVIVQDTDSYLEVNGEIALVSDLPPVDPIENGFLEGAYLIGFDLEPGRYRVLPVDGSTYWARLDEAQEIVDNNLSEGPIIVIVDESDWALEFRGQLEPAP